MRRSRLDLRFRIAVALAVTCIAVVAALGVTLYLALIKMEQALVEQIVSEEMDAFINRVPSSGSMVPQGGPNLQYYVLRSPEDYDKLPPALQDPAPGSHEVGSGAEELYAAVRNIDGVRYIVVYDSGQHEIRAQRFRELLGMALGVVALTAIALGYWLAGLLTRQLRGLASRVSLLAPDESHDPLERPEHDPEVAALAHALDEYHARMVEMMHREQEFTANASHELRTPLTAIRTTCELLASDLNLSDKAHARVDMIDRAAMQMTERMEALLFLARHHPMEPPETVALRRCVEEAASTFKEEMDRKKLEFDVQIPAEQLLRVDRKALQLVLSNLIKNAVRYTKHGYIRVNYEGNRFSVADSGCGIDAHHLPQLGERYYRVGSSSDGLGLGLAIVRRICDDFGWKLQVESTPGAGSVFSVALCRTYGSLEKSAAAAESAS